METRVDELLTLPIQLTELIRKSLEDADSFRQERQELWKKVEQLAVKLRAAARVGPGNLYGRPTRRIMAEVEKTLEKALALVKKCKRSGILKRVITITSAADFKKVNNLLDNGIADVSWLLNVSAVGEDRPESGGVPPIAIGDPVLATIWSEIATVQVGTLEAKTDSASVLADYAEINERNGKLIIDEGGLPPLLRLLKEGNVPAQEAAANCLGVLARDHQRVQEILEERAVEVFIGILTNGSMKVQVKVAEALAQMVEHSGDAQDQFAQAGAIRLLVSLLAYDTLEETSKIQKAISIHTLVKQAQNMSQGAPIAKPVDGEMMNASPDHESKGNLSMSKPVDPTNAGGSPVKSFGLENSRLGVPSKPASAFAKPTPGYTLPRSSDFRTTSFDYRTAPESRGGGVGHHGISRHRLERDREDPETKQRLKAEAAHALWKLAIGNVKNSKSITDTRALLCFAKMIESGEGEVRMNSIKAVMEIARAAEQDAELRRAAFKTNSPAAKAVVEQLLRVIDEGIPELQLPCIKAIGCLARIFPAPALKVIKPLTYQLASPPVAAEACVALQKFANKDNYLHLEHSRTILENAGAGHLVQLILFEPQAKIEALVLLSYLALNVGDSEALEKAASLSALESATRWSELPEDLKVLLFEAIQHLEMFQAGPRPPPQGANFLV
ncbi:unnamed protein product [Calypogeia fissa]